jgi:hypothetical protein
MTTKSTKIYRILSAYGKGVKTRVAYFPPDAEASG